MNPTTSAPTQARALPPPPHLTPEFLDEVDAAMQRDKKVNGYWQRSCDAALQVQVKSQPTPPERPHD